MGIATLSDPRLDFLAALHKPKKVTPATVELLDTPGLMPGTHGDNPQRLALIREGDALLIVLGAFAGGDPAAELAAFRDEMLFADLGVVTNRAERLEASVKKPRPDREAQLKELDVVKRVQAALEAGEPIASLGLSDEEKKPMRSFGLLTDKPQVVAASTPSRARSSPTSLLAARPRRPGDRRQARARAGAARARASAPAFMADLGITELGRDRIIRKAYDAVGIITFFTAGEPEVRGWNLERGGDRRRCRRQDPHRPGQGLHPRRGHRLRRPRAGRHDEGSQGQEPPAPRRQGLHRQGRRHHLLPQRPLTPRRIGHRASVKASAGAPRGERVSARSTMSRLASQRVLGRVGRAVDPARDVGQRLTRTHLREGPANLVNVDRALETGWVKATARAGFTLGVGERFGTAGATSARARPTEGVDPAGAFAATALAGTGSASDGA